MPAPVAPLLRRMGASPAPRRRPPVQTTRPKVADERDQAHSERRPQISDDLIHPWFHSAGCASRRARARARRWRPRAQRYMTSVNRPAPRGGAKFLIISSIRGLRLEQRHRLDRRRDYNAAERDPHRDPGVEPAKEPTSERREKQGRSHVGGHARSDLQLLIVTQTVRRGSLHLFTV